MSTIKRILASRANGALAKGPSSVEGKRSSSRNATTHGLFARQIVLNDESLAGYKAVKDDHLERLRPADGMQFGMVEEMVASHWRYRRALAMEARLLQNEAASQNAPDALDRMTNGFADLATRPALGLMHRYLTRLNLNYQRSLQNLLLLRVAAVQNEPRSGPGLVIEATNLSGPRPCSEPRP